jgi:hypothetical protein
MNMLTLRVSMPPLILIVIRHPVFETRQALLVLFGGDSGGQAKNKK